MAHLCAPPSRRLARGLTLVEILVGVAIGLIGLVAIFQAVAVWSKHTQTTSSGSDAQMSGTLALFNIERDLKLAGHGFGRAPTPVAGCTVGAFDNSMARNFNFGLRAVEIAASAGGAPDQINVLYGNSSFYVEQGDLTGSTATTKTLRRRGGFKRGDLAVVADGGAASAASANCQLVEINDDSNADGRTVGHTTIAYSSYYAASGAPTVTPRYNGASGPAFATGTMYNLGPDPRLNSWSILDNKALVRTDVIHGTGPLPVADGVINMKAEYGVDANNDGRIAAGEWTASAPGDWRNVLAIRVAVLVRSRQFERNPDTGASGTRAVTPTAARPYYFGDPSRRFLMKSVNGDDDTYGDTDAVPNNWRYYRYRGYERVIPLRNMIWGNFE